MADAGRQGLEGLLACLEEQQVLRATGAVDVGDAGIVFMVFGHPLHAVSDHLQGLDAVERIAARARERPDTPITWRAGVTAGRAHSLAPADRVMERLRRAGAPADDPSTPSWEAQVEAICAGLERELHRHARPFVEALRQAPAEPGALLMAIDRARARPTRAVSPVRLAALLDAAADEVRRRAEAGP